MLQVVEPLVRKRVRTCQLRAQQRASLASCSTSKRAKENNLARLPATGMTMSDGATLSDPENPSASRKWLSRGFCNVQLALLVGRKAGKVG